MKRACSRCRKEHRACEGGLPCRRCVALGSPERCHNNDDDIEQRKKQEGRCSRQAKSLSITAPTKQKPELGRQEQTCPKKPHQSSTPSSSSSSPPPQGSAMHFKGDPLTRRQGNPGHLSPLFSSFPLSEDLPKKKENDPPRRKSTATTSAILCRFSLQVMVAHSISKSLWLNNTSAFNIIVNKSEWIFDQEELQQILVKIGDDSKVTMVAKVKMVITFTHSQGNTTAYIPNIYLVPQLAENLFSP